MAKKKKKQSTRKKTPWLPAPDFEFGRQTRAQLARMLRLHQLFLDQWRDPDPHLRFFTAAELGKLISRSRAAFFRLLDCMRDDYNLPIEFIPERGGYGYTQEVTNFPAIQFTQGELIALFTALNALKSVRGNPFDSAARSAFEKLALALDGQLSVDLDALESVVCFRTGGFPAPVDAEHIEIATRAAIEREELLLHHRKLPRNGEKPKTKVHRVQPYFLLCAGEVWYLYTRDLDAKAIRRFALARIQRIERTGRHFKLPPNFDRNAIIGTGFGSGVYGDENPENVRIHFTPALAPLIRERLWHSTQAITPLDDGGIELAMTVPHNLELENWIRSWGRHAKVLQPDALRKAVKN